VEGTAPLQILGETAYPLSAASARVRIANFAPFLREHGIDLDFRPALSSDSYRRLTSRSNTFRKGLILAGSTARALAPRPPHNLLLIHRLRLINPLPGVDPPRRLDIYDVDDALFVGSAAAVNARYQWAKQEGRRSLVSMRRARLVIVGNAFLADHARRHARRVEIVPSCVDPARQPVRSHERVEVVTIGWIGSHTTAEYLRPLLPVIARLNEGRTRARLIVVGGDTGVCADWLEHRPWALATEPDQLAGFDVGIMPLPDTEWARGKCGYKLLQYFAAGVPAVASPVGMNAELLGDDRGLTASSDAEWRAALEQLIGDVEERRQRGAACRSFVEREYSYGRWAPEVAAMLQSLTG
jgi:glycosyltransferase involved in cell wall biosynthesis